MPYACPMTNPASTDTDAPVVWEPTVLPQTSITLERARARLSGLHFAMECLSDGERDILYIAEGLLRLLDTQDDTGYAR